VGAASGDGYAHIAAFAVNVVLAQALSATTDAAVITMIDALGAVVVPKLTLVAVVVGRVHTAVGACWPRWLRSAAEHTQHVASHFAVQGVREWQVARCIVTVSTRVPLVAVEALHLDIPAVVYATKTSLFVVNRIRTIAGLDISWRDVVGVVRGLVRVTERALGKQVWDGVVGVVQGEVVLGHEQVHQTQ
jgi:hypothetical protein